MLLSDRTHCWWECKLKRPFSKSGWCCLPKPKVEVSCHPAIPLPSIHLTETKASYQRNLDSHLILSLLMIGKLWTRPHPLAEECLQKVCVNTDNGIPPHRQERQNPVICIKMNKKRSPC